MGKMRVELAEYWLTSYCSFSENKVLDRNPLWYKEFRSSISLEEISFRTQRQNEYLVSSPSSPV